jgi:arsenite methyltransferase
MSSIEEAVRDRYAAAARRLAVLGEDDSCSCDCCQPSPEHGELGLDGSQSLGCGSPVELARLQPGEVVLDLGSGAGLDVLLAAGRVGPGGRAYGVDMTVEMLELAERNRARLGVENAAFLQGTLDRLPLPDASVDVVISNCVINLATDKGSALRQAFRVLRPGGRLAVADMVRLRELPAEVRDSAEAWACCVAGALEVEEYRKLLAGTGFESVRIELVSAGDAVVSAHVTARKPGTARA